MFHPDPPPQSSHVGARHFRLGQPVVVVPFIPSGGWHTLEERLVHQATTVEVPPSTKGMVVEVANIPFAGNAEVEFYKILWETEEFSWHHSSLIYSLDADMAAALDAVSTDHDDDTSTKKE